MFLQRLVSDALSRRKFLFMKRLFLLGIVLLVSEQTFSQRCLVPVDLDTTYIESYYHDLILRVYSANRNNFVHFVDVAGDLDLKYRPNDYFDLGAGVNYKWFGLNVGTRIAGLSDDDHRFGKTTTMGLQSYLYAQKFTLDFMALKTRGYYLHPEEKKPGTPITTDEYYRRRDLRTRNFGVNLNYVLNNRRFSYKAAFKQNDRQKKSAGSAILGAGVYLLTVRADSAFVPRGISNQYFMDWRELDAFECYSFNGNLEYAYSWVPVKNWITTASYRLSLGMQGNIWSVHDHEEQTQFRLNRSGMVRLSTGYHFHAFYLGITFVRYQQNSNMRMSSIKVLNGTNFTEITVSKRIKL